jgi:hypothetical protein
MRDDHAAQAGRNGDHRSRLSELPGGARRRIMPSTMECPRRLRHLRRDLADAPGLSHTPLTQRLRHLTEVRIISVRPKASGSGLVVSPTDAEVCTRRPGFDDDAVVETSAMILARWHTKQIECADAIGSGKIRVTGA